MLMPQISICNALTRLARAEARFLAAEFLAPVVCGRGVSVSIANVRCTLHATPADFRGWGVFRPISHASAWLVRDASADERRRYLELFPEVRVILLARVGAGVTAIVANDSDCRFDIAEPIVVQFADECDIFDTVVARFDGSQFWFDEVDARADPSAADYLRRELMKMTDPARIARRELTAAHRAAYAIHYDRRMNNIRLDQRRRDESRLKSSLAQAGASLRDFADAGDSYRVAYVVDGARHVSVVRKNDLTVLSAGICLSGEDRAFDLNSLVGVLREGTAIGRF
jgi:hypothetical protein